MENIIAPRALSQEEEKKRINGILENSLLIAQRTRFMYWIPDNSKKEGGSFRLVATQEEVPKGVPFQECICMGK